MSDPLIFAGLNRDEFEELLVTLPRKMLIFPISARPEKFTEYIKGYRPDKILDYHIKTIYDKLVFEGEDPKLVEYLNSSIKNYLQSVGEHIGKQAGQELERIENGRYATKDLEQLVDIFLEQKFKLNVHLYLKMKDIPLPPESVAFLREKTAEKKKRNEIAKEITRDLKKQYSLLLRQKDKEISRLHKECGAFEDEVGEYIEKNRTQAETISGLQRKYQLLEKKYTDGQKEKEQLQARIEELNRQLAHSEENSSGLRQALESKRTELAEQEKQVAALSLKIEKQKEINVQHIPEVIESNPLLKANYLQFIRREWLASQDQERDNIRRELAEYADQLEQVRAECAATDTAKTSLEQEILALTEEKNRLQEQLSEFEGLFKTKIKTARTEISSFLAEVAVCQGSVGFTGSLSSEPTIYRSVAEVSNSRVENICELNDLLYFLEENLQRAGIMKRYKGLVAQYTAYCWLAGRPLLVFGSQARALAHAVSALVCNRTAEVLTLPVSFNNTAELVTAVDESLSSVVLIESAVLGCAENVYLPLIKRKNKKMLLFSVDFAEQMALLPQGIFPFLQLLGLDALGGGPQADNYIFAQITGSLFMPKPSEEVWRAQRKALKKVSQLVYLSPTYIRQRTNCLSGLSCLNGQALTALLVCEIIPYFAAQGKQEELETLVEELKLPESDRRLLELLLERK